MRGARAPFRSRRSGRRGPRRRRRPEDTTWRRCPRAGGPRRCAGRWRPCSGSSSLPNGLRQTCAARQHVNNLECVKYGCARHQQRRLRPEPQAEARRRGMPRRKCACAGRRGPALERRQPLATTRSALRAPARPRAQKQLAPLEALDGDVRALVAHSVTDPAPRYVHGAMDVDIRAAAPSRAVSPVVRLAVAGRRPRGSGQRETNDDKAMTDDDPRRYVLRGVARAGAPALAPRAPRPGERYESEIRAPRAASLERRPKRNDLWYCVRTKSEMFAAAMSPHARCLGGARGLAGRWRKSAEELFLARNSFAGWVGWVGYGLSGLGGLGRLGRLWVGWVG